MPAFYVILIASGCLVVILFSVITIMRIAERRSAIEVSELIEAESEGDIESLKSPHFALSSKLVEFEKLTSSLACESDKEERLSELCHLAKEISALFIQPDILNCSLVPVQLRGLASRLSEFRELLEYLKSSLSPVPNWLDKELAVLSTRDESFSRMISGD